VKGGAAGKANGSSSQHHHDRPSRHLHLILLPLLPHHPLAFIDVQSLPPGLSQKLTHMLLAVLGKLFGQDVG